MTNTSSGVGSAGASTDLRGQRDALHALVARFESRPRLPATIKAPATKIRKLLDKAEGIAHYLRTDGSFPTGQAQATEVFGILVEAFEKAFAGIPNDLAARIQLPNVQELPPDHDAVLALAIQLDRSSTLLSAENPTVYAEPKALLAFMADAVKRLAPPRVPHRDPMISLCVGALAHSLFPRQVAPSVRKLLRRLEKAQAIAYSFRNDPSPAFESIVTTPSMVAAEEVFAEIDAIYTAAAAKLGKAVRRKAEAELKRYNVSTCPASLESTPIENRQVLRLAKMIRAIIPVLQTSTDEGEREAMHALRLAGNLLEALAPAAVVAPIVECMYCFRHGHTSVCPKHANAGSRASWAKYRETLAQATAAEMASVSQAAKKAKKMLQDVYAREKDGSLSIEDIETAFRSLLPQDATSADVVATWSDSLRQAFPRRPTKAVEVTRLARSWYEHPTISDPLGVERLHKPIRSVLFKLFHDVARFEAFQRAPIETELRQRVVPQG